MAQALERPVCTARIAEDDSVEVVIDRVPYEFASMPAAIEHVVSIAGDLGRPVKLTAIDPTSATEPETSLIVSADGSVAADASASTRKRPSRGGSSRVVTVQDLVPEPEEATGPVAATEPAADLSEHQPMEAGVDEQPLETPTEANVPHSLDIPVPPVPTPPSTTLTGDTPAEISPSGAPANGPQVESAPAIAPARTSSNPTPVVVETGDPRLQLRREENTDTPESPARHGWRGWCNQALGTSFAASAAERATRARRVRIQRPLETHRTVAVLQLKGGGGKTTTAYHLAATAGRVRGGNILAGEFNENQGTLAERSLAGGHDRTTLDLIRNLDTITRRTADLVRYVRPQGDDRIHVLASPPEGTDRTRVDGRSVRAAHETLSSLYSLILLDTGNSAQSSTWRAAVDVADSLVLVAHNREDDARLLEATVAAVQAEGHGQKLARSVLVVSNTATNNTERLTRLREYAQAVGLAGTVVIPFDKSLQEGRAFHYDALHPATVRAYEEATATLIDQL